jgi:hypothetical protein
MERIMNQRHPRFHPESAHLCLAGGERGVVMFIALLVMVALSLAGIALIRSSDTATVVAGNLAFKQAAASAVDRSIEQAISALFDPVSSPGVPNPVIADKTVDPSGTELLCLRPGHRWRLPACQCANSGGSGRVDNPRQDRGCRPQN